MAPWILWPHYIQDRCWNNFEWVECSWHLWRLESGCSCPTFSWSVSGNSPLPGNDDDDDDTRGTSDIVSVPVEMKESFVNPIVDDDDDEDNDEFYVREEEDDNDVEFRRNAFDVIIDDEE